MQRKVITKRIISPDGQVIAEVRSEVITSDEAGNTHQEVEISTDGTQTRVSGYSRASSSSSSQTSSRVSSRVDS